MLLRIIGCLCFGMGALWRTWYLYVSHPPKNFIYSDMKTYLDFARRWIEPSFVPNIGDSLGPLGASMIFGLLDPQDPTLIFFPYSIL